MTNALGQNLSPLKKTLIFIAVVVIYYFLGAGSLQLATLNDFASPIWSPSGFAMGSLLLLGRWLAPAVFAGAFFTNLSISPSLTNVLGIASGNMLEAYCGSLLIQWLLNKNTFKQYSEFMSILIGSLLSCMISATIGVATLWLHHLTNAQDLFYTWYTWWSGDSVGCFILLPLFLELHLNEERRNISSLQILMGVVISGIFSCALYFVFVEGLNQAFAWIISPFFLLAGVYLGKLISRAMLIIVALTIVVLTAWGQGPFEYGDLNLNLIYVQSLLLSFAVAVLFVRTLLTGYRPGVVFTVSNIIGWTSVFLVIYITASVEKKHMADEFEKSIQLVNQSLLTTAHQSELLLEGGAAHDPD